MELFYENYRKTDKDVSRVGRVKKIILGVELKGRLSIYNLKNKIPINTKLYGQTTNVPDLNACENQGANRQGSAASLPEISTGGTKINPSIP